MSTTKTLGESFGLTESLTMTGEGPAARRAARRARASTHVGYRTALLEAKAILESAWAGDKAAGIRLNEAITTSDLFKSAAGEVLDTMTLASYEDIATQWTKFAARTTVPNFKPKRILDLHNSRRGLARVPEKTNYPIAKTDMEERFISVGKFGEQFGYTFEARLNDEYGELEQVPNGWAVNCRYTEDDEALEQLADGVTGAPNPEFFNAGNGNLMTGTLDFDNLETAYTTVTTKRSSDGRLRSPGPLQLIVGPALSMQAERLINTSWARRTLADGSVIEEPNPLRGKFTVTVMDNLPGTAWFLVPLPSAPRPAFYVAFLRGFETPDVRFKNDQGQRVGGGAIPAEQGSFDNDTVWYRVRHIVGAAAGDPLFTMASDGLSA